MLLVNPASKGGFGLIHWKLHAREPMFDCQADSVAQTASVGLNFPSFDRQLSQFDSMALFYLPRG